MFRYALYGLTFLFCSHAAMAELPSSDKLKRLQEALHSKAAEAKNARRFINPLGKCLDVAGDVYQGGTAVKIADCNDALNQKWWFEEGRLRNAGGKCLDLKGDPAAPGMAMQIFDCNDAPNQKWRLEGERIINQAGKCLDVKGDPAASGAPLQSMDCNDAPNQKWRVE